MVNVKPGSPRAVTKSIPGGIRVTVRSRKNWFLMIFLPVWLVFWAAGARVVVRTILEGGPGSRGFLVGWLLLWTIGGAFALAAFLWMAFGREIVETSGGSLRVRREAVGFGRSWSYELAHVQNLRCSPAPFNPFSFGGSMRYWGFGNGGVGFDYGASTIRVLPGLDESEANKIVDSLRAHLGSGAALRA